MAKGIQKEARIAPEFLVDLLREKGGVDDPHRFFEYVCATGDTIKRSLLVDGKFPRSSIRALGNFLLKWIETAKDESFINVIARYKSRRGADTARLEIVHLIPQESPTPSSPKFTQTS
jgi:hypothetical protein